MAYIQPTYGWWTTGPYFIPTDNGYPVTISGWILVVNVTGGFFIVGDSGITNFLIFAFKLKLQNNNMSSYIMWLFVLNCIARLKITRSKLLLIAKIKIDADDLTRLIEIYMRGQKLVYHVILWNIFWFLEKIPN